MDYDKYVKIPMFIILDRNICNNNKILYGIIILLSHKEGYCYADNKYLGNWLVYVQEEYQVYYESYQITIT